MEVIDPQTVISDLEEAFLAFGKLEEVGIPVHYIFISTRML